MSGIATQRLKKELKDWAEVEEDEIEKSGVNFAPVDDSLMKFNGQVRGPPDTPYENGKFLLEIHVPDAYPFRPPKVKFVTRVWHPNVSSATGAICVDLLKDNWSPSMCMHTLLMSLQSLLAAPQPNDPQDAIVAGQFLNNIDCFKMTARYWAQHFARAPGPLDGFCERKMSELRSMGYSADQSLEALSHCEWNVEQSVNRLLFK